MGAASLSVFRYSSNGLMENIMKNVLNKFAVLAALIGGVSAPAFAMVKEGKVVKVGNGPVSYI